MEKRNGLTASEYVDLAFLRVRGEYSGEPKLVKGKPNGAATGNYSYQLDFSDGVSVRVSGFECSSFAYDADGSGDYELHNFV